MREARTASLRQAGSKVLHTIANRDADGLIQLVGDVGLAFGVDKTWLSRNELQKQFAHKEGAYCLFFSTSCIPEMGNFKGLEPDEFLSKWRISYVEWLRLNRIYATNVELLDDDGGSGCGGYFSVSVQKEVQNAPNSIELYFNFEKGKWWLVNTVAGVP